MAKKRKVDRKWTPYILHVSDDTAMQVLTKTYYAGTNGSIVVSILISHSIIQSQIATAAFGMGIDSEIYFIFPPRNSQKNRCAGHDMMACQRSSIVQGEAGKVHKARH